MEIEIVLIPIAQLDALPGELQIYVECYPATNKHIFKFTVNVAFSYVDMNHGG